MSESPLTAVILEARQFCSGATGRNGGHLTPNPFNGFRDRHSRYGVSDTIKSYALEDHTAASIVSFIHSHNLSDHVDLVHGGHYKLFTSSAKEAAARADYEAALEAGWNPVQNLTWLDAKQMNQIYGASYPGYRTSSAYNLWPLKLVTHLYNQALKSPFLNLTLHTHTPVLSINRANAPGKRWTLNTSRGTIDCTTVLHATNGYASHLLPHLSEPIIPTRGQIIAAEVTTPSTQSVSLPREGSWATSGDEYWFPRPNSTATSTTIILGGGRRLSPDHEQNEINDGVLNPLIGGMLRTFLPRTFSGIEMEVKVMMEWTGIMGFTTTGHPLVGQVAEGQYISAGFNGHGMPLAYGCADVVARMVAADLQSEKWQLPTWFPQYFLIP
ncbi:hypothetical protein APHAL10511_003112 [Amanita phalloides]|nr:hypothetical protein APHAL10511_003112 [Amanita phalloides]